MSNRNKLVSVVLCTYNGERFLREQLESLSGQTHRSLEIIIVDDCSTDGTAELLNLYASENSSIHLYFNESNLGFNKNFEKALALSTGDFIAICDQDDIWLADKIANLLTIIGDNWAVCSNSEYIDEQNLPLDIRLIKNGITFKDYKSILLANFFTGHTSLISRESLSFILPIPKNSFYDWWIGFVCLYHQKLIFQNEVLTFYRIHQNSVTADAKLNSESLLVDIDVQLQNFLQYKNLQTHDKKFISNLKSKLKTRGTRYSIWFDLLKDYSLYFPDRRHHNLLSKLNFIRKFLHI